jgi:hypothetical protein
MKMDPIACPTVRKAADKSVVSVVLIEFGSFDKRLRSSPVRFASKNPISCRIIEEKI